MLVLRRKIGESLLLANTITITILAIEGDRVKIGISAPDTVSILRKELLRGPVQPAPACATHPSPHPDTHRS